MKTRIGVLLLGLALGLLASAQEKPKSPGLAYLLDDAVRIYVVDESRCSANPTSKKAKQKGLKISDVRYRSPAQPQVQAFYQAALLLSESPTPEEIAKAKAVLPGIRRVIQLCECKERARG